jgi:hypothetical protein
MLSIRTVVGCAAVAIALLLAATAAAELTQNDNLLVSFNGGITPHRLPRATLAPVTVRLKGEVKTTDASPVPQLRQMTIAINRHGRLFDRGLPGCAIAEIQAATTAKARSICGRAQVGSGSVAMDVALPNQAPFTTQGRLLAFKGSLPGGQPAILASVYSKHPPASLILPFLIHERRSGAFGTTLTMILPRSARRWAYVTGIELTLKRRFTYRGRERSYLSADCPTPKGFDTATFPFARASFAFAGAPTLRSTISRSCEAAG